MFVNDKKDSMSASFKRPNRSRLEQGTSLIEVIVSLLILGVGLLGVLSLQANGLNGNQRANFVTDAQILAQDMADRILAAANAERIVEASNPLVPEFAAKYVRNGNYAGINVQKGAADNNTVCNPTATACDVIDAKEYNENEWLSLMTGSSLPQGRAIVAWNEPIYRIQVMWDQERVGGAVECTITNCFQMEVRVPRD